MKNRFYLFLLAFCGLLLLPQKMQANDYLEHQEHYTVQSMGNGVLRFETEDGTPLVPVTGNPSPITYAADIHYGSLHAPLIFTTDDARPYKVIEDDHVVIIRNNERYDITGKKLQ